MKTMLTMCLLFLVSQAFAALSYYPQSTVEKFQDQQISIQELQVEIFNLSNKTQKRNINYDQARKIMFGELFLETLGPNKYALKEVYCNITIDEKKGVGPKLIPNAQFVNCEHTWPQSKFSKEFPSELQKSDLHHLFPADMRANSTRNNYPFAEVVGKITHTQCPDSQIGNAIDNPAIRSFEPPMEHKGNVARAMFYFSTRYKMPIDSTQAKYLKLWNSEDPVDQAELERNDKIMQEQGNRNPFIDYPELINRL